MMAWTEPGADAAALDLDVAVIGAGPAGLAFVETLAGAGLSVGVFDEQPRPGGQILRQPPPSFAVEGWSKDRSYRPHKALLRRAQALDHVHWLGGASVLGLTRAEGGFEIVVDGRNPSRPHRARRVLVATGCQELAAPFPGWTTPGVMTAGAVQTLLKSQGLLAGERIAFCGVHPLQVIVADQVAAAGGGVAAVVFAQPLSTALGVMRHVTAALAAGGALADFAAALVRLRRAGVPVRFGEMASRVLGDVAVEAVQLRPVSGQGPGARLDCDTLALCFGFTPQSELPRALGADYLWDEPYGGWRVTHDGWMRSSVPGLYVAGEVTGVGGADKSAIEGRLAGLGVLLDSGLIAQAEADVRARVARNGHRRVMGFARMLRELTAPADALERMADPAGVVCRCEGISGEALQGALRDHVGVSRPSALKLLTRAGMGPCGGRNCETAIVRMVAQARGREPEPADAFTPRFPARATPIRRLI